MRMEQILETLSRATLSTARLQLSVSFLPKILQPVHLNSQV